MGENRHTYPHPSKSAVLGLIAGALGIRREEEITLRQLSEGYGFSVLVNAPGIPVIDFHTIQSPPAVEMKKMNHFLTRKDELGIPREKLETILSRRDYLCDLVTTVCLWQRNSDAPYSIEDIAEAISSPVFVPYLGRKSCPVSIPMNANVTEADSVIEAISKADFKDEEFLGRGITYPKKTEMFWDEDAVPGIKATERQTRRDNLLSRKRWQYADRREFYAKVEIPGREG